VDVKDRVLTHLDRDFTRAVRDPLWGHIYLTDGLMRLVNTDAFQQLSRIKQLGPAYLVYPGATHTRLSHSLGVFHVAHRVVRRLVSLPDAPDLTLEGVIAFLCAALLHDVGHFPFTHSLKELPLEEHELLSRQAVTSGELAERIRSDVGIDPATVGAIIDETAPDNGDPEIGLFRRLLSGALDPDKLDYLNRDAYFCGVPYGTQDIDYVLSRLLPLGYEGIALDASGVSAVENILFSKYLMYRAVYWHRTVRIATAMVKKGLFLALANGLVQPADLYGLDDESFFGRFSSRTEPPFSLVEAVYNRRLHRPVAELAIPEDSSILERLTSLPNRLDAERRLAALIAEAGVPVSDQDVVIDLPEGISFEVSFPVIEDGAKVDYTASGTVFTRQVVDDFTHTLRRIRVMIHPRLVDHAPPKHLLIQALLG
jgi:uncharacterized protein